ncbi:cell division topological specificity factor [Arenimonas maotaiensis]|jgi:cell division topological specificity factor|uniref:Cell division topological specificity factor n=1 Tax=Arenimonas maotaiensis TaxID=1446479 RepID=A0A917CC46_9GAMM|nr:cell division topological specificity factor MinE [Arenimonas maotaiensis]GGF83863.1 cell division topological specificity factor [Arenimonas maotaiensis]
MGLLRNIIEQLEKLDSKPTSAATAKNRLQILVNQTRRDANAPDYMPRLRSELLEVIKKYVQVNEEAVKVNFEKDRDGIQEVLDIQIALPDKG